MNMDQPDLLSWVPAEPTAHLIPFPLARRVKTIRSVAATLNRRVTQEGKAAFWTRTVNGLREELQRRALAPAVIEAQLEDFREAVALELARQQHGRQQA
jgi:hypothetical protein